MFAKLTPEAHLALWRAKFRETYEEYKDHYAADLAKPDLYKLIDGVDAIVWPQLNSIWNFNPEHIAWNWGQRVANRKTDPDAYKAECLEYLNARKHLTSAVRVGLTAWLLDDTTLQSWTDKGRAAEIIATAFVVRDLQAVDVRLLREMIRRVVPNWIPEKRRADWQKYVGR